MDSREDKLPAKARAEAGSLVKPRSPVTLLDALTQLRPVVEQWAKDHAKALDQERAQAERECARLEREGGLALSRLLRCLDMLLQRPSAWFALQSQGFFEPLQRYALWLAEEARREHAGNEALRVALYRVDTELEAAWSMTGQLKKRLHDIREELFGFLLRAEPQRVIDARALNARPEEAASLGGGGTDLALKTEREAQIAEVLADEDGVEYLPAGALAAKIQGRFKVKAPDESTVRRAIRRMRAAGWPIETNHAGSRIPPSQRAGLPGIYRSQA